MLSIDGFPIRISIDMTPDHFDPPINQWSTGKVIKIEVDDGLYRPIVKTVEWKSKKTTVYDYELFTAMVKDWMKREKWSKDRALDEFFDTV